MARRRKKKKRVSVKVKRVRRKKSSRIDWAGVFKRFGKIAAVLAVVALIALGFIYLQRYVDKKVGVRRNTGSLVFANAPLWFNDKIKTKIFASAVADGENFRLDEDAAWSVRENLESDPWLSDVKVQVKSDHLEVLAKFHRPLAMVEKRGRKYYIDHEMNVLDYIDVIHLPVIRITGVSTRVLPGIGEIWTSEEAAAAIKVLASLDGMDARVSPEKPLLFEIDSINVSNFQGRKSSKNPHIVLFTQDETQIIWGAQMGSSARYFESPDAEKLNKLYNHYKEHGTLQGNVRYIELRIPQGEILQPIDFD